MTPKKYASSRFPKTGELIIVQPAFRDRLTHRLLAQDFLAFFRILLLLPR
jgi:hypothetical protein